MYGSTETTIWSTAALMHQSGAPVTIGRPIANTQVYVVDSLLNPVPVGVAGELWIGGDGVTRGYLGRPDLTAERFVPDPFSRRQVAPGYTSDRRPGPRACLTATWNSSGRIDQQGKIHGFRIELGEIETVLRKPSSGARPLS